MMPAFPGSRTSGFSPTVCIRRITANGLQLQLRRKNFSLAQLGRSDDPVIPPFIVRQRHVYKRLQCSTSLQHSPFSTSNRRFAAPFEEDQLDPCGNRSDGAKLPPTLENLTVKELRDILARQSLKVSGSKSELIARLQGSSSESETRSRLGQIPMSSEARPPSQENPLEDPASLSGLTVKELRGRLSGLGLSINGSKAELIERLVAAQQEAPNIESLEQSVNDQKRDVSSVDDTPVVLTLSERLLTTPPTGNLSHSQHIEMRDFTVLPHIPKPFARAQENKTSIVTTLEPHNLDSVTSQDYLNQATGVSYSTTDEQPQSDPIQLNLSRCESVNGLSTTEMSERPPLTGFSNIPIAEAPLMAGELPPASIDIGSIMQGMSRAPSDEQLFDTNKIVLQLQGSEEALQRLRIEANAFLLSPHTGKADKLYREGSLVSRSLQSKKLSKPISQQRSVSLAKLYFSKAFQRGIDEGPHVTKSLRLVDFPYGMTQDLQRLFIQNVVGIAETKTMLQESDFEAAWISALTQLSETAPKMLLLKTEEQSLKTADLAIPSPMPENELDVMKRSKKIEQRIGQRPFQGRAPLEQGGIWKRSTIESLAKAPVTLRLTVSEMLRQKFLFRPDSDHILGNFRTDGDPFCQIFNSMWIRLGLMDYVLYIGQGEERNEYMVTFNSFDAASAFVNRPYEHYIDDQMAGPIHASWDAKRDEYSVTAIVILPQHTLDIWRREALKHNVAISEHGYPIVEWTKSMRSVLNRMRYSIGMHGDCRRYRVIAEYNYRTVMEVSFKDQGVLNNFLARKTEHFLTNYWKDRFFAKPHVRLGFHPEWMNVPTEDDPVPSVKDLTSAQLKKVFVGVYKNF